MHEAPLDTALKFVDAINSRDLDGICALMTDDHIFIDSVGHMEQTKEKMREGWEQYLEMFPDYQIRVDKCFGDDDTAVLLGSSSQTFFVGGRVRPDNHYEGPAAWRVRVRDGLVAEWQVFADNTRIWQIINRAKKK